MEESKTYTLEEAHKYFAQSINGRVWELLQKSFRSDDENDEMLHAAHACAYHWMLVGNAVNQQRGEWLISHVHVALGHAKEALRHAERCFEITQSNKGIMKDFDIAYAFEGIARSQAMLGDERIAKEFFDLAQQSGNIIADEEDIMPRSQIALFDSVNSAICDREGYRSIFVGDFTSGDWYRLK